MRILIFILCVVTCAAVEAKTSATIEDWTTRMEVSKSGHLTIAERIRIKVFDKDGYDRSLFYTYYNSFRSVNSVHYTVYDASGNRVKRKGKNDATDVMLNPSYEVGDTRVMYIEPDFRSYPFVVEIEFELDYNGFIDFPLWMPRYVHDLEVKKASLTFVCPSDYKFRTVSYNGAGDPAVTTTAEVKQYVWNVQNLPAVAPYGTYKAFAEDQARVRLAPFSFQLDRKPGSFEDWQHFGEWYLKLNEVDDELLPATKKELDLIREASGSQREMIEEVYRYMQGKTRYVSIQLGIGGFKSLPLAEVDERGYGDCKALSTYTKAMLDYLKVPSNYVLVYAGDDVPDVVSNFPSNQFNHVFLAVPLAKDTVWLECTSQLVPASYLGTFTDDRHALWIASGKSRIIHTPAYSAERNTKVSNCRATVDANGDVHLTVKRQQSGVYFGEVMAYKSLAAERLKNYNDAKFRYKDFSIQSFDFSENRERQMLMLNYGLKVHSLVKRVSDKLILPTNLLDPVESEIDVDRLNKITDIRRAFTLEDNVTIEIPKNHHIHFLPTAGKEESEFGTVEVQVSTGKDESVVVKRKVVINKGSYRGESYEKFNSFLDRIKSMENAKIVFQNKT